MACMGPSKDLAYARGEKAFEDVLELLKEKYQVSRPVVLNNTGFEVRMQKEWDQLEAELKKNLQELVWVNDAASF